MRLSLPSETQVQPDEDPLLLADPPAEHHRRAAEAITALAEAATSPGKLGDLTALDVVVSHVDHQGLLSPLLYGFSYFDDGGTQLDVVQEGGPVHFVAVLNQPVARQVESVTTLLPNS